VAAIPAGIAWACVVSLAAVPLRTLAVNPGAFAVLVRFFGVCGFAAAFSLVWNRSLGYQAEPQFAGFFPGLDFPAVLERAPHQYNLDVLAAFLPLNLAAAAGLFRSRRLSAKPPDVPASTDR